jgi:hypothetical protein
VGPIGPVGHREGDHEVGHRSRPQRGRHRGPAERAAADRGAPARDGQAGPPSHRGGAGRGHGGRLHREPARVEVRNHRRDAADQLKKALRGGELSEDEERRELDNLQRVTDRYIEAIDGRAERKEAEILEV